MQKAIIETTQALEETAKNATASDNQEVVILITGFVIVFMLLLLLIGFIKIYSGIVYAAQNKAKNKKASPVKEAPAAEIVSEPEATVEDGLDLQTIAVITAAVEAYYSKDKKVRVTGIRPVSNSRSEWATAGLYENIPAMRSEGLL